jgi:zinc D-Ala-D-Ala carboxypeptidase
MEILRWFTYTMNMSDFKYFNYSEFDSPDEPGSGEKYMSKEFIEMLSEARDCAGIPFFILSGYRTRKHNATLKNSVKNSTHCLGIAADIRCRTSDERWNIIDSLLFAGFNRIGIGESFLHVDLKQSNQNKIWTYY